MKKSKPINVGDVVAIGRHIGHDTGGTVIMTLPDPIVFRQADGSHDSADPADLYVVARGTGPAEPSRRLAADEFANGDKSVDRIGIEIIVGCRVESLTSRFGGIVIAIARGALILINDETSGDAKVGEAVYENCHDVRVRDSYAPDQVESIASHVYDMVDEGKAEAAEQAKGGRK